MNTLPDTHVREASGCPSPVTIWQTLLTRLLDQHYGLTPGFSAGAPSQLINSIDILRARRATGLMTRNNYRMVNNITQGKHPEAKR